MTSTGVPMACSNAGVTAGEATMKATIGRCGALLALLAAPALAHHGVAPHYDESKRVTLDGIVSKFDFINPHSFVYIDVVDASGKAAVWSCELASRSVLERNGLTTQMFAAGKHVRIEGLRARQNPTGCALREAYFDDGSVLRASTLFGATPATTAPPATRSGSIEGVWAMRTFSVSLYEGALTEEGERLRAAFDPIKDDPAIYCDPASPVRFWINVNEPFELRRETDRVVIDHQFMDSRRIIHLAPADAPADEPRSSMGYSVGHFEGNALIVHTDHFVAATLEPRRGVMHTADLELTEKLELNPGTGELEITWTISDPAIFKAPYTQKEIFVRTERGREPYDCKPGYQQ
jgi:Family of unknown function (DUF6152)